MIGREAGQNCKGDLCFYQAAMTIKGSMWTVICRIIVGMLARSGRRALAREEGRLRRVFVPVQGTAEEP
jgi:hypothetical protein